MHTLLTLAPYVGCALLLVICCFLNIDVKRAVASKEGWKEQSIEADKSLRVLGDRCARLMSVLRDTNASEQELRHKLEDTELALAFEKARGVNDERAINYWRTEWQLTVDELREARSIASLRTYALGKILEMPGSEKDWDRPDAISRAVCTLIDDLQATKGLLEVASEEIAALAQGRDEVTALLAQNQIEAAELAKEREDLIMERDAARKACDVIAARPNVSYQVALVAEAILEGRGLGIPDLAAINGKLPTTNWSVRDYVVGRWIGGLDPNVDAIVLALDDFKKDLKTRMERLRAVESERDRLIFKMDDKSQRATTEDIAPPVPSAKRRLSIVGRRKQAKRAR